MINTLETGGEVMNNDRAVHRELVALLEGGNAHMGFGDAVAGFPKEGINRKVPNGSYSIWHLVEHMRIVQWDILEFVRSPDHLSPDFPDGYWPNKDKNVSPAAWQKSVKGFLADLEALVKIARNPRTDFFSPIPHARDYTIFRELLLAADHNAYHVGELASLRRVLNLNPIEE